METVEELKKALEDAKSNNEALRREITWQAQKHRERISEMQNLLSKYFGKLTVEDRPDHRGTLVQFAYLVDRAELAVDKDAYVRHVVSEMSRGITASFGVQYKEEMAGRGMHSKLERIEFAVLGHQGYGSTHFFCKHGSWQFAMNDIRISSEKLTDLIDKVYLHFCPQEG